MTASIDYRLSGESPFPVHIQDCKAAVRFLRANAKQYGIDPDKIGATGSSAGGHLAALLATSSGVTELEGNGGNENVSSAIQAAVPMCGQTDFLSERNREISRDRDIWREFLGGSQEEQPETYRLASPLVHLDKTDPPCWIITGQLDDPSTHADKFRKRLDELGIETGMTLIEDAPHGFLKKQVWFDEAIEITDKFFTKTLK